MPKYNVSISFSLRTMIEPEGIYFDRNAPEGVEDVEDSSYFRNSEIDADGGHVSFTVECESEDEAERLSEEFIFDGQEWEDDSGFTWQVDDRSVEVEVIEIPMDLGRATTLVQVYLASMEGMDDDLKEAFGFLLDTVTDQEQRIAELSRTITTMHAEVQRLRPAEEVVGV